MRWEKPGSFALVPNGGLETGQTAKKKCAIMGEQAGMDPPVPPFSMPKEEYLCRFVR